jgi:hypothetical protein
MRMLSLVAGGVLAALLLPTPADTQQRERRLTRVVVTPERVSVAAGGTQQFRVYGLASTGDTVALKAIYRATGGVITAGGLYTAGPVPGSYQVTALLHGHDDKGRAVDRDDAEDADDVEDADHEGADDDEDEIGLAGTATVTVTGTGGL